MHILLLETTYHFWWIFFRKYFYWGTKYPSAIDKSLHYKICHWGRTKNKRENIIQTSNKPVNTLYPNSLTGDLLFLDNPAPRLWFKSKGSVQKALQALLKFRARSAMYTYTRTTQGSYSQCRINMLKLNCLQWTKDHSCQALNRLKYCKRLSSMCGRESRNSFHGSHMGQKVA